MSGYRTQEPSVPSNWLYEDWSAEHREFFKTIMRGEYEADLPECTNDEKEKWEAEHPQPTPEDENKNDG